MPRVRNSNSEDIVVRGNLKPSKSNQYNSIKSPADRPGSNPLCPSKADRQNFFFDLQLWQPVDLLPFDLQRPKVPL